MHAAYGRGPATSAASCFRDSVPATPPHHLGSRFLHAPPLLDSPLQQLNIRYSPALHQGGLQHATSSPAHCRRSQAPAHSAAAADVRSVPLRSSDVSCVNLERLGDSDAAPSSPIRLTARTAVPRLAPRKPHFPPLQPRAQRLQTTSAMQGRRSQAPAHSAAAADARTVEDQRRQLRHP